MFPDSRAQVLFSEKTLTKGTHKLRRIFCREWSVFMMCQPTWCLKYELEPSLHCQSCTSSCDVLHSFPQISVSIWDLFWLNSKQKGEIEVELQKQKAHFSTTAPPPPT